MPRAISTFRHAHKQVGRADGHKPNKHTMVVICRLCRAVFGVQTSRSIAMLQLSVSVIRVLFCGLAACDGCNQLSLGSITEGVQLLVEKTGSRHATQKNAVNSTIAACVLAFCICSFHL